MLLLSRKLQLFQLPSFISAPCRAVFCRSHTSACREAAASGLCQHPLQECLGPFPLFPKIPLLFPKREARSYPHSSGFNTPNCRKMYPDIWIDAYLISASKALYPSSLCIQQVTLYFHPPSSFGSRYVREVMCNNLNTLFFAYELSERLGNALNPTPTPPLLPAIC